MVAFFGMIIDEFHYNSICLSACHVWAGAVGLWTKHCPLQNTDHISLARSTNNVEWFGRWLTHSEKIISAMGEIEIVC